MFFYGINSLDIVWLCCLEIDWVLYVMYIFLENEVCLFVFVFVFSMYILRGIEVDFVIF